MGLPGAVAALFSHQIEIACYSIKTKNNDVFDKNSIT
jgi:hypothetical protein